MTSTPPIVTATATARSGRLRSASIALLGMIAVLVCIILLNALAQRFPARIDVTATGEHKLAPRTQSLLASLDTLDTPYRVVLAGELSAIDRPQLERIRDVLAQMQHATRNLELRYLDTASADGQQEFHALIADLAARDRDVLDLQSRSIRAAAERALSTADYLESGLAPGVASMRDLLPMDAANAKLRETLDSRAAGCRLMAKDLRAAAQAIEEPLSAKLAHTPIPQTETAARSLRTVLTSVGEQLGGRPSGKTEDAGFVRELVAIAGADVLPTPVRNAARALIEPVEKGRDAALTAADTMSRLTKPDVLRIAAALSQGSACIVVGPPQSGLMAIEFEQLFPAGAAASAADAGRRAEQLISTAISALSTPVRPILVIMHGEAGSGVVTQKGIVTRLIERLTLRGIDVAEWAAALQADPPALTSLNPDGKRPIVYATIPPDSSAARIRPTDPTGAERAQKFGAALEKISAQGSPILLSMYPSVLPSYGDPDPTVAPLARFGLSADTARPIMRERLTPQGRLVDTEQSLRATAGEHSVQKAIRGLSTLYLWPIAIRPASAPPTPAPILTPLFEIPPDTQSWSESQWLNFWRTPRGERAVALTPPEFDEGRDQRLFPLPVAYAAELPAAAGKDRQRLLAIGSNRWFMDPITTPLISVDGRTVPANPGNLELIEAAIYWLAGQDDLIAQTPEARAVAIIEPISATTTRFIRLATIVGLPLLILLAGALYRLTRG